jgi:hypothetical protein
VEADVEDLAAVGEAISEDPTVQAWRWSWSRRASGGEMIVGRVRV